MNWTDRISPLHFPPLNSRADFPTFNCDACPWPSVRLGGPVWRVIVGRSAADGRADRRGGRLGGSIRWRPAGRGSPAGRGFALVEASRWRAAHFPGIS